MATIPTSQPFVVALVKALGLKDVKSLTLRLEMGLPMEVDVTMYPDMDALNKMAADPTVWPTLQTKQADSAS